MAVTTTDPITGEVTFKSENEVINETTGQREFTPATQTVTSETISDQPEVPFVPSTTETPVDTSALDSDVFETPSGAKVKLDGTVVSEPEKEPTPAPIATPFADEAERIFADIQGINEETADIEAFTQAQEDEGGEESVTAITATQKDKFAQARALGLESQRLANELTLAEERVQQESLGRGRTVGGVAPITAGRRREIALAQADVASRALTLQAELYAIEGKLSTAQDAVDRAVEAKYGPLLREKDNLIENLNLLNTSGILSREESKRAEERLKRETAEKEKIQEAKDLETELKNLVIQNAMELSNLPNGSQIMEQIKNSDSVLDGVQILTDVLGDRFRKQLQQSDRITELQVAQAEANLQKTRKEIADTGVNNSIFRISALDQTDPNYVSNLLTASAGGGKLTGNQTDPIAKGFRVIDQLGDLQATLAVQDTGPIQGIINSANPYNVKAQQIKAQLIAIVPQLARGVYGEVGVLTDTDVDRYVRTLPNLSAPSQLNDLLLGMTLNMIKNSVETELRIHGASGRDVSGFIPEYNLLLSKVNEIETRLGVPQGAVDITDGDNVTFDGVVNVGGTNVQSNIPESTNDDNFFFRLGQSLRQ